MNWGFWFCVCVVPCFLILGVMFATLKEKSAKFVSGFNYLSEEEQKMYDKAQIARDMRNSCFIWSAVMTVGAVLSCFLTPYMAIAAYVVWGILVFKDVHLDAHKAFEKYLLKLIRRYGTEFLIEFICEAFGILFDIIEDKFFIRSSFKKSKKCT